jgi:hypothetical protein
LDSREGLGKWTLWQGALEVECCVAIRFYSPTTLGMINKIIIGLELTSEGTMDI